MLTDQEFDTLRKAKATMAELSVLHDPKDPRKALPRTPEQETAYREALATVRSMMLLLGKIITPLEAAE